MHHLIIIVHQTGKLALLDRGIRVQRLGRGGLRCGCRLGRRHRLRHGRRLGRRHRLRGLHRRLHHICKRRVGFLAQFRLLRCGQRAAVIQHPLRFIHCRRGCSRRGRIGPCKFLHRAGNLFCASGVRFHVVHAAVRNGRLRRRGVGRLGRLLAGRVGKDRVLECAVKIIQTFGSICHGRSSSY